jgi:hypothetical protein
VAGVVAELLQDFPVVRVAAAVPMQIVLFMLAAQELLGKVLQVVLGCTQ